MSPAFRTCLAEGLALFNAGRFFEAHEAWESAWLREKGPRRALLQGLILVAAGWLKRDAGRAEGAQTLFTRALARLEALPPGFEGVDVGALVPEVRRWRDGGPSARPALSYLPPGGDMQSFEDGLQRCPYCGEEVEVQVDAVGPTSETYVEDCPVCCRPWVVHVSRDGEDVAVSLGREDD